MTAPTQTKVRRGPRYRTTAITYRGSARDCWSAMATYWGVSSERARKKIAEAQQLLADLITLAHRNDREDWIRSAFARLDMARPGKPVPNEPWVLVAAAKHDAKENASMVELLANPDCRDAARQWIADARAEVMAKQEAIYAVETALAVG
jgi:hypothetical protein